MNDVSQLTGIPADRIYKWEKGTKPNDAEDLLKIREYLDGKLERANLEDFPKKEVDPSPMQILSVLADAFKTQAEILRSIESKMAQESTQAKVKDIVLEMHLSLQDVHNKVTTVWERQDLAIEEIRGQFEKLGVQKTVPSSGVGKKRGQNGRND